MYYVMIIGLDVFGRMQAMLHMVIDEQKGRLHLEG